MRPGRYHTHKKRMAEQSKETVRTCGQEKGIGLNPLGTPPLGLVPMWESGEIEIPQRRDKEGPRAFHTAEALRLHHGVPQATTQRNGCNAEFNKKQIIVLRAQWDERGLCWGKKCTQMWKDSEKEGHRNSHWCLLSPGGSELVREGKKPLRTAKGRSGLITTRMYPI